MPEPARAARTGGYVVTVALCKPGEGRHGRFWSRYGHFDNDPTASEVLAWAHMLAVREGADINRVELAANDAQRAA